MTQRVALPGLAGLPRLTAAYAICRKAGSSLLAGIDEDPCGSCCGHCCGDCAGEECGKCCCENCCG